MLVQLNYYFTLGIVFPAVVCFGLYLTLQLRFFQFSQLKRSFSSLMHKGQGQEGSISRFGAISAVLAGNFGTGNISGMAVALTTGGPGALVWMWIMVVFGAIIQYTSCVLSVLYRRQEGNEYVGGPMYYLRDGLGYTKIAALFALFTILGAVTVGNFAQVNSILLPLEAHFNPFICSLIIACFVAMVILGGIQRLASFASYVVPFKALLYLGTALTIIVLNFDKVPAAFLLMFKSAFGLNPLIGGALGATVLKAMTTGFGRGLFATDAGTGIIPILQASARSEDSVQDGIATLLTPILVMIVCTATGLVLLVTDAWQTGLQSTNMVTYAFSQGLGSSLGGVIVLISLILFAYTTILAWAYCGEKAFGYLVGPEKQHYFRYLFVALIPLGGLLQVGMIWSLADFAISAMLATNLIGVIGLSQAVIKKSQRFLSISTK